MRIILSAVVIACLSTQAFAQMGNQSGPRKPGFKETQKVDIDKQKRLDAEAAAAKDAMSKIPDSKEKYDPWKIAK
jgi:hypothetical protein